MTVPADSAVRKRLECVGERRIANADMRHKKFRNLPFGRKVVDPRSLRFELYALISEGLFEGFPMTRSSMSLPGFLHPLVCLRTRFLVLLAMFALLVGARAQAPVRADRVTAAISVQRALLPHTPPAWMANAKDMGAVTSAGATASADDPDTGR
jgi:hypothetical protein